LNTLTEEIIYFFNSFLNRGLIPSLKSFSEQFSETSIYSNIVEQKFLSTFFSQDRLEEIIIHNLKCAEIRAYSEKKFHSLDINEDFLYLSMEVLCLKNKITWNQTNNFVSEKITLFDQDLRLTLVHKSLGGEGHKFFFRTREKKAFELNGFITENKPRHRLVESIFKKKNIIIAGKTGSGKTSFLNSCLNETSKEDHHIVVEDTREIFLKHTNTTYLNSPCSKKLKEYCSHAMRMSPDRVILGEMRSHEVIPFVLLMTSGHKGLMSTIHANSAIDVIERIALLLQFYGEGINASLNTIKQMVANGLDEIIYIKDKKVNEHICIHSCNEGNLLFDSASYD
jgi:Flp pilus assembly CpaF family ATPase